MMAFFAFVTVIGVLWFIDSWRSYEPSAIAIIFTVVFGFLCWRETWEDVRAERQYEAAQEAEAKKRRETPRVIREADGCKVYQFEAGGHTRYFTRCPGSQVNTHWQRTESCGKGCSRTISESIDTQP